MNLSEFFGDPVVFVDRVVTDETGFYTFPQVVPGQHYIAREELPSGWAQTYPDLMTMPPAGEGLGS